MAILPSFQQLRFLRALAEQCHFGRAAESCAVTQSTLSGGIKELEARLGITLFERGHRHVMLTPLGKEIAVRAQRLLVDAEELVGLARNAQEPLSGPLRFGVIPTVGPYILPSLLPHLSAALPKLKLYVREAPIAVLLDKLAGGELDILLVAADLGITLIPQIAVDSELASNRNVVIRSLSPDKPFRTLVLAWRPTSSRGAEFRMLGNLIRECLTGTKRAFSPDQDTEALPA